ncbi:unnamed protein product, partial [Ectocarpus sp. 8 AP-2014]
MVYQAIHKKAQHTHLPSSTPPPRPVLETAEIENGIRRPPINRNATGTITHGISASFPMEHREIFGKDNTQNLNYRVNGHGTRPSPPKYNQPTSDTIIRGRVGY